jgi:ABC-2 type transport system permease protein
MNSLIILLEREFWEYRGSFVTLPVIITALVFLGCLYIVIWHASPDSSLGLRMAFMGQNYADDAAAVEGPDVYIIDFDKGELTLADENTVMEQAGNGEQPPNAPLYMIHVIFLLCVGFALFIYQLHALYNDRKDRSVLFWKSMPVSETRNVLAKLFTSTVAAPVLLTVISWAAQIIFVAMSMLFTYRIGVDPVAQVWSRLDIMQAFFNQILYVLWMNLWMLPLTAWFLFSSAFARSSPFLVAFTPFVVVFLLENLIFGTDYAWSILAGHFYVIGQFVNNIVNETGGSGSGELSLNAVRLTAGTLIAAALLYGTVWLRNHRFEL